MNNLILVGRWTKDVELSFAPNSGTAILKGSIAVDRAFKKDGDNDADFFNVTCFGKKAEATANFCGTKGSLVAIDGWVRTGSYESKKNPGIKMPLFEVQANDIQFLNFKKNEESTEVEGMTADYSETPFIY